MDSGMEIKPMRVFPILALALSLAGCNGDRIKQGMNFQPPSTAPLVKLTT
jgi:hypothetical protein